MGKQEFDLVMSEVDNMAAAVEKFPDSARGSACAGLIAALLYEPAKTENGSSAKSRVTVDSTAAIHVEESIPAVQLQDLEWYADNYGLESISNPKFIAFVAVYHCDLAPKEERVDAFDEEHLKRAYDIVDRKIPKSLSAILSNAKNRDRFVESNGDGMFTPAPRARRFVKKLLNGQDE